MAKTYDYLYKLLLIGDSGVGKTCLLFRFSDEGFNTTFIATIGIDFKVRTIEMEGKKIKLQIWDTAGQERFRTITTAYYRGAMGILLVYDVTNATSFKGIHSWIQTITEHANQDAQRLLIGNKCDDKDRRQVTSDDGQKLATAYDMEFMETSAKTGHNVDTAFLKLTTKVKQCNDRKKMDNSPRPDTKKLDSTRSKRSLWRCSIV